MNNFGLGFFVGFFVGCVISSAILCYMHIRVLDRLEANYSIVLNKFMDMVTELDKEINELSNKLKE